MRFTLKKLRKFFRIMEHDISTGKNITAVDFGSQLFVGEDDDFNIFKGKSPSEKVLGTYNVEDIINNLKEFGIIQHIEKDGFNQWQVETDTTDPFIHQIKLIDKSVSYLPSGSDFLIDLRTRRRNFKITELKSFKNNMQEECYKFMRKEIDFDMELTVIEWICMQNPKINFSNERKQLPGQRHPGLGVGTLLHNMLVALAERAKRDGLLNIPEHFHNALLYALKGYKFVNPIFQGFILNLVVDLKEDILTKGLSSVAWAFSYHAVMDRNTSTAISWNPEEQVYPSSKRMKNYTESQEYKALAWEAVTKGRYFIDWTTARAKFSNLEDNPGSEKSVSELSSLIDELLKH